MAISIRWRLGVATALAIGLAACNGNGNGAGSMPASGTGTGPAQVTTQDAPAAGHVPTSANVFAPDGVHQNTLSPIVTTPGGVDGAPNMFTPHFGDTSKGGQGKPVDKVSCKPRMITNKYHVHIFLGVVHNGKEIALPYAIGMHDPGAPQNGYVNDAKCYYHIHTHDSTGIVHLEIDKVLPLTAEKYDLKEVLNIWGLPTSKSQFGPFKGPMHIFIGNQAQIGGSNTTVDSYTEYTGKLGEIALKSHEVIWVEIGKTYYSATQLPPVTFYMEY